MTTHNIVVLSRSELICQTLFIALKMSGVIGGLGQELEFTTFLLKPFTMYSSLGMSLICGFPNPWTIWECHVTVLFPQITLPWIDMLRSTIAEFLWQNMRSNENYYKNHYIIYHQTYIPSGWSLLSQFLNSWHQDADVHSTCFLTRTSSRSGEIGVWPNGASRTYENSNDT